MNLAKAIREEMDRIAKKVARSETLPLRKIVARHRQLIAGLRRELDDVRKLAKNSTKRPETLKTGGSRKVRFSPKELHALRTRFGLSGADFGLLIGCGGQSVYNYEQEKTIPNIETKRKISAARALSKRAAAAAVEEAKARLK